MRRRLITAPCPFAARLIAVALAAAVSAPVLALAEERLIDTERSTITLHVAKSGLFRVFADNHVISAPVAEGSFDDGPGSRIHLVVDARRLQVLDPGLSPDQRQQVQTRMMGPEVLDVDRFAQIRFQSTTIERLNVDAWLVRGELTLHGETRAVTVKVTPEQGRYKGSASLKQTDFGITPISIAGGAVTVKDEIRVDADIVARRSPVAEP